MQPARDIFIIPETLNVPLDPSVPVDTPVSDERRALGSKIGIDATKKRDFPPVAFPPREHDVKCEREPMGSKPKIGLPARVRWVSRGRSSTGLMSEISFW